MIEISLHLPSLVIGFFIGYMAIAALWIWTAIHDGGRFEEGWRAGYDYGKSVSKPKPKEEVEHEKTDGIRECTEKLRKLKMEGEHE